MSTLFVLLFLSSLGFLIWGLISPSSLSKFGKKPLTRKEAGVGFGLLSTFMFVMVGVTTPKQAIRPTAALNTLENLNQHTAPQQEVKAAEIKLPTVTTETATEEKSIPFSSSTVNDPNLAKGSKRVVTVGVNGINTLTYEITLTDGVQTDKKLVKEMVTKSAVNELIAIGTKVAVSTPPPASNHCDSNYSGCVPIASDVDCAGGSGNGPSYVRGPINVIGSDIYDLDRDSDGIACE